MYLWNIVQMLFEFFTVLLMKKSLFKIFFQINITNGGLWHAGFLCKAPRTDIAGP